jgi:hypothetical protein
MTKDKTYYALVVQYNKGDSWSYEFGDFSQSVVKQEIEDSYSDCYKAKCIKTTESTCYRTILKTLNEGV